jgi:outer membrane PBP1 activator LpoA protein
MSGRNWAAVLCCSRNLAQSLNCAGVNGGAGISLSGSPVSASLPQQQGVTIGGLNIPAPPTDAQISGGGKVDAAYIVATRKRSPSSNR